MARRLFRDCAGGDRGKPCGLQAASRSFRWISSNTSIPDEPVPAGARSAQRPSGRSDLPGWRTREVPGPDSFAQNQKGFAQGTAPDPKAQIRALFSDRARHRSPTRAGKKSSARGRGLRRANSPCATCSALLPSIRPKIDHGCSSRFHLPRNGWSPPDIYDVDFEHSRREEVSAVCLPENMGQPPRAAVIANRDSLSAAQAPSATSARRWG